MLSSARRLVSTRHLRLALAAAVVLCLAAPLSASAANTRYASPTGTGPSPCLQTSPCSLKNALSSAEGLGFFDTVLLAPGTYHPVGELNVEGAFVTVAGEPGQPAPLIEAAGERGLFFQTTGTIHDVRIHSTMATTYALAMIGAESVIERVESTGEAFRGCSIGVVVMRDTVCSATPSLGGGEGIEMFIAGSAPESFEASLFNVTAIGGNVGIFVGANDHSSVTLNATNTIASGGETADVEGSSFATTAPVAVNLSHSNFEEVATEGTGPISVTSPILAGNQISAPVFVDEAGGDYREAEGSPTRLAGDLGVVLPGELDLAGGSRTTNCAGTVGVDIGAYQYECPPPPIQETTPPDNRVPCACPGPGPGRPILSKLALKPAKFTVTGKAPKGTKISFTLSTAASVKLEVLGKKTVKGKKPKTVTLGTLASAKGKSGPNSVKFNGKVKGKPLEPGKYTLRATATGSGTTSKPATATFTVLAATA
jgi:hypothetical protein